MPFRHDSSGVDPNGNNLLPNGEYLFKIVDAEEKTSKNGNDMIVATCKVVNNEQYGNSEVLHYVVFLPKDRPGAGMSVMFRKAIGVPFGGDDLVDADDWVGKKFYGFVIQETYVIKEGDKKGQMRTKNRIESVRSLEPVAAANGTSGSTAKVEDSDVPF